MALGIKNLSRVMFGRGGNRRNMRFWTTLLELSRRLAGNNEKADYSKVLETARCSSVVMGCVGWIATMLPRCPWKLEKEANDGGWEDMGNHDLIKLLNNPTPQHSGAEMLSALLVDFNLYGSAYWHRVGPTPNGPPTELWWRPQDTMSPALTEDLHALAGYDYQVGEAKPTRLAINDVVQVRKGQHPQNSWLGESPLAALAPELYIEGEATNMSAAILRNLGLIGLIIAMKESKDHQPPSDEEVEATRAYIKENYTADQRGDTLFLGAPVDVHGGNMVSPDLMHPKMLHDFVEERVCAIYRLPAAVVQFGIGLEQSAQNATMVQLEKQAWLTGALPDGGLVASQIGRQLMPAFELDPEMHRLSFDTSKIEVLQRARTELVEEWGALVRDGIATRAMALEALNLEVLPADHVRHLPINIVEVPAGKTQIETDEERRAKLPQPLALTQGNAGADDENGQEPTPEDEGKEDDEGGKSVTIARGIKALTARERQALVLALRDDGLALEGDFQTDLIATFEAMGRAAEQSARDSSDGGIQ